MASVNETEKVLRDYFEVNWTTTAIKWPRIPFDPRKTTQGNRLPYVSFIIREGQYPGGGNVTLGSPEASRFFRWSGIIVNEVFIPENNLDAGLMTRYLGMLTDLWNMQTLLYVDSNGDQATCRLRVPHSNEVGIVNGWDVHNLITPYIRDSQS